MSKVVCGFQNWEIKVKRWKQRSHISEFLLSVVRNIDLQILNDLLSFEVFKSLKKILEYLIGVGDNTT